MISVEQFAVFHFFISFLQAFIERGISIVQIPNAKR